MLRLSLIATLLSASLLGGCDLMGDSAEKVAAAREADGRAIGSACRHAGRAIEDCYALNKKADKASVFAGWRDMNDYMRENKIDAVPPSVTPPVAGGKRGKASADDEKVERAEPEASAGEPAVQIERKPAKATAKPADDTH